MDSAMLWLWAFGAAMLIGMFLIARLQSRQYRSYLERHTAETAKVTENQARLIAQTDAGQQQQERLIAELARIAAALEKP